MISIPEVYRRWPTHDACVAHLETVRWGFPAQPVCPYCKAQKAARHNDASRGLTASRWQCWGCNRSFSVTVGTIFHNTHVDLQRWFLLISLMLNAKKGLSAMQAARDLQMRRPTVWSMMHRIRKALKDDGRLLRGLVEMDEAYIGGKPRKRNRRDDDIDAPRGRATRKQAVVGIVERGGRVKTRIVANDEMSADDMREIILDTIDRKNSYLTTDEHPSYARVNDYMLHRTINHSREYVSRDLFADQLGLIHTNTIESFWAILKRAIHGQFHHVSRKYLSLYLNEISYRYNMRKSDDAFGPALALALEP